MVNDTENRNALAFRRVIGDPGKLVGDRGPQSGSRAETIPFSGRAEMAKIVDTIIGLMTCFVMLGAGLASAAEPSTELEGRRGAGRHDADRAGPDVGLRLADDALAGRGAPARGQGARPGRRERATRSSSSPATSSASAAPSPAAWPSGSRPSTACRARTSSCSRRTRHSGPTLVDATTAEARQAVARGLREQPRLHARTSRTSSSTWSAQALGKMEPASLSLRRRPRPLRPEPPRADRQGDQARQEPRRPHRRERADPPRPERRAASRWPSSSATPATTPRFAPT